MSDQMRFLHCGDSSLVVEFGNAIAPNLVDQVRQLQLAITTASWPHIVELIPTYRSLMICYNPLLITAAQLIDQVRALNLTISGENQPIVLEIPVCYQPPFAPDLVDVADYSGLAVEQVVARHTAKPYLIYMLGFTPGFPYLGGMDQTIAMPRLDRPRSRIQAGAVGIAGEQTGIYPMVSPSGWRIIGQTPILLFDAKKDNPCLLRSGDYIQFVAITTDEYHALAASQAIVRRPLEQS